MDQLKVKLTAAEGEIEELRMEKKRMNHQIDTLEGGLMILPSLYLNSSITE